MEREGERGNYGLEKEGERGRVKERGKWDTGPRHTLLQSMRTHCSHKTLRPGRRS